MGIRKTQSDWTSKEIRDVVASWWELNTRVSPCPRDYARVQLDAKVYDSHQVHWLEETEVNCLQSLSFLYSKLLLEHFVVVTSLKPLITGFAGGVLPEI